MTEPEREKLVADLASYIAAMAPHQKERMGGKLILRAFEAFKSGGIQSMKQHGPDTTGPDVGSADPGN